MSSAGPARIDHAVTTGTFSLDGGTWEVDNNVWVVGDDSECIVIDAPPALPVTVDPGERAERGEDRQIQAPEHQDEEQRDPHAGRAAERRMVVVGGGGDAHEVAEERHGLRAFGRRD